MLITKQFLGFAKRCSKFSFKNHLSGLSSNNFWRTLILSSYFVSQLQMSTLANENNNDKNNNKNNNIEMEYRLVGQSGLKVSCLGMGTWATFSEKGDINTAMELLTIARESGINYFDTAEEYSNGKSELMLGNAIYQLSQTDSYLWRRSDIIISTKIFWGPNNGVNEIGLSRKHIIEGINDSLKRLKLDYIDIVYAHRPDILTSTEEIVFTFNMLINNGKILYYGTSEWTSQQITEAYWICKINKLIPPIIEQTEYNLFQRSKIESEYIRLYNSPYFLGISSYSPLDCGILTGKYNNNNNNDNDNNKSIISVNNENGEQKEVNRLDMKGFEWLKDEKYDKSKFEFVNKLNEYAKKTFNTNSTVLSIAWCLKNKHVSTVLIGASKPSQLKENLNAINIAKQMTKQHMDDIDKIMNNKPPPLEKYGR